MTVTATPDFPGFSFLRFLFAASTIAALLGLLSWGLRYWATRKPGFLTPLIKQRQRRLNIIESLAIDPRHRLVIVRCDQVEHLLLLGPQQDRVVASNPAPAEPPPSSPH